RAARGAFREEILPAGCATKRATVRRDSRRRAGHPSARSCRRCYCASDVSANDGELQFVRAAVCLFADYWLLAARAAAGAVSRREFERGCRRRATQESIAAPGLESSWIRGSGGGGFRKGNPLPFPQRANAAHPDH